LTDPDTADRAPETAGASTTDIERVAEREPCDYCGALALEWRKCKLICAACHQINKSCADL
jgi:hypothetical protein